jgi:hypothetical protein
LYFVQVFSLLRDREVVGVFVRFRAPLGLGWAGAYVSTMALLVTPLSSATFGDAWRLLLQYPAPAPALQTGFAD